MGSKIKKQRIYGREFDKEEITLIKEVIQNCSKLSRMELAQTMCELLEWKRPAGGLKAIECMDLLERLEDQGVVQLPAKKTSRPRKPMKRFQDVKPEDNSLVADLVGSVEEFKPLDLELVKESEQRAVFRELLSKYHYLGWTMPYGARLQYLAYVSQPQRQVVGCIQFSSPAWRIRVRDDWIGWDDATRGKNLQHIISNSRFLVVPRIHNLASSLLSLVLRRVRADWFQMYAVDPWLVETLVDPARFDGGCYRAANWIPLGKTAGTRSDRHNKFYGAGVKSLLVYRLAKDAEKRLRGENEQPKPAPKRSRTTSKKER